MEVLESNSDLREHEIPQLTRRTFYFVLQSRTIRNLNV